MEGTATISLSESPYGPPDPSVILPRDEKNDISALNVLKKIKGLSKIGASSDLILFAIFVEVEL